MDSLSVEDPEAVGEVPSHQTDGSATVLAYERAYDAFRKATEERKIARNRLGWMRSMKTYLIKRRSALQEAVKRLRDCPLLEARKELKEVEDHLRRIPSLDVRKPRDPVVEQAYCTARHHMMRALAELEEGDAVALRRKLRYMSAANLPRTMDADDVLYYCDNERVHLFYGGRLSPPGDGFSPDGQGHAHVVLIEDDKGGYLTHYHREPKDG